MAIISRHIRHDWQTFVDWNQKSVRSVCEVTTQRHLAGIPGITEHPTLVEKGDKQYWGWCVRCVKRAYGSMFELETREDVDPRVKVLYDNAAQTLVAQYEWQRRNEIRYEAKWHAKSQRHLEGRCKTDGRGCMMDALANWTPA